MARLKKTHLKLLRQADACEDPIYAPCDDKTFAPRVRTLARMGLAIAVDSGWRSIVPGNLSSTRIRGMKLTDEGRAAIRENVETRRSPIE